MAHDLAGGLLQLGLGFLAAWRRVWWAAVAAIVVGLFILWADAADAACRDVHGYWTVAEEGDSDHQRGGNSVEINRLGSTVSGSDSATVALHLDPGADWTGCGVINYTITYEVALTEVFGGVPIAAAWASDGHEDNQTGTVGSKSGTWLGSMTGPASIEAGAWLNGSARGFTHFSVNSQWTIAPERMAPYLKRRIRSTVKALNLGGDAAALVASTLLGGGNSLVGGLLGLSSSLMKASARLFQQALDADPWDAEYKRIFRPVPAPVPAFVKGGLFRAWVANQQKIRAAALALYVAINRANTARAMNDAIAEDRQPVDSTLKRLGRLFEREIELRERVGAKLADLDTPVADSDLLTAYAELAADLAR
jgi:hypothetical protein